MKISDKVKPISYLKANAASVLSELADGHAPYVITQNGEAKAVIQGVADYEKTRETLALLKILALGTAQIEAGDTEKASTVIQNLRRKRENRQ